MTNPKWERKAKNNHFIALAIAVTFHLAAVYTLAGGAEFEVQSIVPDFAKEWLDMDTTKDKKDTKQLPEQA